MTVSAPDQLRQFPLHEAYVERGAKMGAFGEWEVPLYFDSILTEHEAVRHAVGLFDISHMGEFFISGKDALKNLQRLLPRNIEAMQTGQALYMPLLNETGGIIDDIIAYRIGEDGFLLIVNAGNVAVDEAWFKEKLEGDVIFLNRTDELALLALQGPKAEEVVRNVFGESYAELAYYHFSGYEQGMISRTGYTGEDGFEIMVPVAKAREVFDRLLEAGAEHGLKLIGFGARDTLRLEAGMLLHGHDMNNQINPLEVRIGWAIDKEKTDYIGAPAVIEKREQGVTKKIAGFEMIERGIPREAYAVVKDGRTIGKVTSGTFSPTLKKNIGLAIIDVKETEPENEIEILIRDKPVKAKIVKLPFYKRKKS